jgi:hypothetical protein
MDKKNNKKKLEVRFLLSKNKYKVLKSKAENADVPLASYAKVKLEKELEEEK